MIQNSRIMWVRMDLFAELNKEIASRKREIDQLAATTSGGKKVIRLGDVERMREEKYLQEQQELENARQVLLQD